MTSKDIEGRTFQEETTQSRRNKQSQSLRSAFFLWSGMLIIWVLHLSWLKVWQFRTYWQAGSTNLTDYVTKHNPAIHRGSSKKMVILRDSFYFSKLTDILHLGDYITHKKNQKKSHNKCPLFSSENEILRLLLLLVFFTSKKNVLSLVCP